MNSDLIPAVPTQFDAQILGFNAMYKMPGSDSLVPSLTALGDTIQRLKDFSSIMQEEVGEATVIADLINGVSSKDADALRALLPDLTDQQRALVAVADWLGDIAVYAASEARRYGMALSPITDVIMASNASKLGADGLPIYDERNKLQKGPNYWKPEPKLAQLLASQGAFDATPTAIEAAKGV